MHETTAHHLNKKEQSIMKKRVVFNSSVTAFMQLTGIICGFIVTKLILTMYSAEASGFLLSIIQTNTYVLTAAIGITGAATYALYKPLADKDYVLAGGILNQAEIYFRKTGAGLLAVNVIVTICYITFFSTRLITPLEVAAVIIVNGSCTVVELVFSARNMALLVADQRTYVVSLTTAIANLIQMALAFIVFAYNIGIEYFCFIYFTAAFIRCASYYVFVKCRYKKISLKAPPAKHWESAHWSMFVLQLIILIQTAMPIALAIIYTDLRTLGVFAVFNLVAVGIQSIFNTFVTSFSSMFGNLLAKNDKELLRTYFNFFEFLFLSLVIVVYVIAFATIAPFMELYAGEQSTGFNLRLIGILFLISALFFTIQIPQMILIQAAGKFKKINFYSIVQIVIQICGALIFAPEYGLYAILISTAVATLLRHVIQTVYVHRSVSNIKLSRCFIRQITAGISIILCIAPIYKMDVVVETVFAWLVFAAAAAVVGVLAAVLQACIFERDELKMCFSLCKNTLIALKGSLH